MSVKRARRILRSGAALSLAIPICAPLLGSASPLNTSPEETTIPSAGDRALSCRLYRPPGEASSAFVLLHGAQEDATGWDSIAVRLAANGALVACPHLTIPGEIRPDNLAWWQLMTLPRDDASRLWDDATAAVTWASEGVSQGAPVWVGGSGAGAIAAAVAASRLELPLAGLLLLSPLAEIQGVEMAPLALGLGLPVVAVAARGSAGSFETARTLFVAGRQRCRLWELTGGASGTVLFRQHPRLAADLVNMLLSTDGTPEWGGERP